ncbi:MAG TPA: hypothetical protein DCS67_07785, partial [Clostridiales bacterium UBA8960]|nr:hypothetical protein [Clostridiales bacterium UBA8960]
MKTLRHYTLLLEIIGLCIILIMSVVVYLQLRETIVEDIIENQRAQIDEIQQYIDKQFDLNLYEFEVFNHAILKNNISDDGYDIAIQYLYGFSDLYQVNLDYEITEIHKKENR